MKVNVNRPAPVVAPPPTVDLIGLTMEEVLALRALLARRTAGSLKPLENLRRQLWMVTKGEDQIFSVSELHTFRIKPTF